MFDLSKIIPLFLEGMATFFSPCVLPIIPLYVAYLTNWATKHKGENDEKISYGKFILLTLVFIAGVSVIFFVAAFSSSVLSQWLTKYSLVLEFVASFVIILFALYYLGVISIPWFNQTHKLGLKLDMSKGGYLSAFLLGFLFSFGWTPCIGPMLGFAFSVSLTGGNNTSAFIYVMSYAAGFMIMFVLLGIASKWVLSLLDKAKKIMPKIVLCAGVLMLVMGCVVFYQASVKTVALQDNQSTVGTNNNVAQQNPSANNNQSDETVLTMEQVNFTLEDKEGNEVSLTDYKGKKTLVMFFGTWCGYCRMELPELQKYADTHDDLNILLVSHPDSGINDETKEVIDRFMEENDYTLDYVYDYGGAVSTYFTQGSFPSNFFFNSDGTLLGQLPGAMNSQQMSDIIENQMY